MSSSSCIRDGDRCLWTGALGYCCSGNCIQNQGEEYGQCSITEPTSSSASSVESSSTSTTASSFTPCLADKSQCRPDGSLGTCCSFNCFKLKGQSVGVCVGSEPPPDIPARCLDEGADCTSSGSLGFCCLGLCHVIAPHTVGICMTQTDTTTQSSTEPSESNETRQVENNSWILYTSIFVTLSLLILLVLGFFWLYRRQRKLEKDIPQNEADYFFNGDPNSNYAQGYAHENIDNLPYNKELEISESDFSVDMESQLGSGCFGLVLKGKVRDMEVAAKTIRSSLNGGAHLRSLLSEIKTLQYIGTFETIVGMIGCNTSNISNGKVFLFLEYCPLGSLEKYLRANKYNYVDGNQRNDQNTTYENAYEISNNGGSTLGTNNLLMWGMQITNAMKYLAAKKVIHADLATRNVLLLTIDCAKLTDFGLSRRLYEYGNYVKKNQEPLPWRWMALESLASLSFSHQSDVWSLGITFWEIFTLGDIPYPGLSWTNDFISCLRNNLRPTKPPIASDELYDIMLDCWKPIPETRPTFDDIYKRLYEYQKINNSKVVS